MDAVGLLLLILFLIALGMSLYYALLCIQAYPLNQILFNSPDRSHLLAEDHDMNGNHELECDPLSAPPLEADTASLPDKEEADEKARFIEPPLKSIPLQITPECASIYPTESVILNIEDEPSPSNTSKSIVPPTLIDLSPSTSDSNQIPNLQETPVKTLSVSFEEDGLLVPRNGMATNKCDPTPCTEPVEDSALPRSYAYEPQNSTPKQVQPIPPFTCSPSVVDTSNLPYSKAQQHSKKPHVPVFHFSTPNSGPDDNNEALTAFSPKHKHDLDNGTPTKKVKISFPDDSLVADERTCKTDAEIPTLQPEKSPEVEEVVQGCPEISSECVKLEQDDVDNPKDSNEAPVSMKESNIVILESHKAQDVSPIGWCIPESQEDVKPCSSELKNDDNEILDAEKKESESESSEPEITEYSFESGPGHPTTASVLAAEVGCYTEPKINLTQFASLNETPELELPLTEPIVQPNSITSDQPTPTKEQPITEKNIPVETSNTVQRINGNLIIGNPNAQEVSQQRERSISTSSSSSLSSSNGSYTFDNPKIGDQQTMEMPKKKSSCMPDIKQ